MPTEQATTRLYGLAAEFDSPESVLAAAHRVHAEGYRRAEAYSPFAVHGLAEALGSKKTHVAMVTFIAGILGGLGAFFMQWYANVYFLRWDSGGKPPNSWPAFIPITFELTVLAASLAAAFGMLFMNKLPMPYHPMFNLPEFSGASRDRFFLCIEADDPKFDLTSTRQFLEGLAPLAVSEVPK